MDDKDLYEFIGYTKKAIENLESSVKSFGERIGVLETRPTVLNGWKKPAMYVGGGGISLVALVELIKSLFGK